MNRLQQDKKHVTLVASCPERTLPNGWVLHVNECLRDASSESNKETVRSVQSGSDEERKAVAFEDSVVEPASISSAVETTAVGRVAHQHSKHSKAAPADLSLDPCLFHSYTAGCAKGEECEYSHSVHADRVLAPTAKQKRGHARLRIKKRLTPYFAAQNLYEVHEELQKEARQDSYAKELIRRHLTGTDSSTSATSAASAASAASGASSSTRTSRPDPR
eukprot:s2641_g1.t3